MDEQSKERLRTILSKGITFLNNNDKAFLRARRSYLTKAQSKEYDSILNPKEVTSQTSEQETVKTHATKSK